MLGVNDPVVNCIYGACSKSLTFNSIQIGMVSGTGNGPFWTPDCAVVKLPSSAAIRTPAVAQLGSPDLVGVDTDAKMQSAVLQTMPPFDFSLGVTSNGGQSCTPDDDINFTPQQILVKSQSPWETTTQSCKCNKYTCIDGNYICVRWWDYSSTVLDPGGTTIWTLQE